jgi:hypothetical protein
MNISPIKISWPRLCLGFLVAGILALSVHAVMLQVLNVPFPDMSVVGVPYRYLSRCFMVLGLIYLCERSANSIGKSPLKRWVLLFLLFQMLSEEIFRAPFMAAYCTTAWIFPFVSQLPRWLSAALLAALIVLATPWLRLVWQKLLGAVVLAAVATFALTPLCSAVFAKLLESLSYLAPTGEWCTLPYGWKVLVPAYLTFVEPTIACFIAAALVWRRLSPSSGWRFLQFTVMIVAIKNQLITPFVYALLAKEPGLGALASDGQFALEALVLAVMTGVAWKWASDAERPTPV